MKVIGLLGGIGSGKSTVAQCFAELGASKIDADQIGHKVLRRPDVREAVKNRWGSSVFDENGWIDRASLAKIVFRNSSDDVQSLADLEAITHPKINDELQRQFSQFRKEQVPLVILDAPVLLKAGWDRFCDHLIFVDCPWVTRVERVARRGWSADDLKAREATQTPLQVKKDRCGYAIDTSMDHEHVRRQVKDLWEMLSGSNT